MYIRYNSEIYRFLNKKEYYKIITRYKNKTTDEFYKNKDVYVKKITKTDINIQDIFNVQFFLRWDSHFEKVDTLWEVFADKSYLNEDHEKRVSAKEFKEKMIKYGKSNI